MTKIFHGKVRGNTIEFEEDLGMAEGEEVEVQVRLLNLKKRLPGPPPGWQPGNISTTAGVLADMCTVEDDHILDEIYRDRHKKKI